MTDNIRTNLCLEQFDTIKHLDGNLIELGVAFGATTFPLAKEASKVNKLIYACDTFEGLPYDDSIITDWRCVKGEMNYGKEFFANFLDYSVDNVVPVRGLVEDTLPTLEHDEFCFAWVDMDLYQPTSFAYKWLENRIVVGGIIGFHDYKFHRCPGIEVVVDKEIDYTKYQVVKNDYTCIFLQRIK